mmetsp:Transcript_11990/g.28200  ORF Transcript_11990/g.28200 Transcript_11990/m.28200 type:complete len:307 (+) Transcript_11990:67-987(+)
MAGAPGWCSAMLHRLSIASMLWSRPISRSFILGTPELSSSLSRSVAGLARSSSATASTSVSTRLSACTSLSLDRCCSDTFRKRRVQLKKSAAEQSVDSTVAIQKPPTAFSTPETRFIPKKPETIALMPMHSPAMLRVSSKRARRLRSLSSCSSRVTCVVSMLVASSEIRSLRESSRALYTSSSVSTSSCSASRFSATSRRLSSLTSSTSSPSSRMAGSSSSYTLASLCAERQRSATSSSLSSSSSKTEASRSVRACRELRESCRGSSLPSAASRPASRCDWLGSVSSARVSVTMVSSLCSASSRSE